jgi:cytoskeletal protein CcmA (bactofilin family)
LLAAYKDIFLMAWFDRQPSGKKDPEKEPEKTPRPEVRPLAEPAPVAAAPAPAARVEAPAKASEAGFVAHLYRGSRVTGQLSFQGSANIDGCVDGEIRCQGTLTVGEGAEVKARISGDTVIIRGRVDGNVTGNTKVELTAPARVYGNIHTPRLVIAEGVVFDGDCSMGVAKDRVGIASSVSLSAEKAAAGQKPKLQIEFEK